MFGHPAIHKHTKKMAMKADTIRSQNNGQYIEWWAIATAIKHEVWVEQRQHATERNIRQYPTKQRQTTHKAGMWR